MFHLAFDGITSFSIRPIRLVSTIGFIISLLSLTITLYAIITKISGNTVSGWTFTICSIWLLGGVQIASIGLIGEYVGKTYIETKHRPKYHIEKIIKNR